MFQTLNGKPPFLNKLVFELRYPHGLTYLDRCGHTVNRIQEVAPEWLLRGASPQGAPLVHTESACTFNFSAMKLDLSLEQSVGGEPLEEDDVKVFGDQSELLTSIVLEQLGLREFTRIGFRAWFLFSADTSAEAETWLSSLGCVSVTPTLQEAFGGKAEAVGAAVVIVGEDRKFRVALNGVQRLAQLDLGDATMSIDLRALRKDTRDRFKKETRAKRRLKQNPGHAGLIDIDAFQEDPDAKSIAPRDFIRTSYNAFLKGFDGLERARMSHADRRAK